MMETTNSNLLIVRGKYSDHKEKIKELSLLHWEDVGVVGAELNGPNINDELYQHLEETNSHLGLGLVEEVDDVQTLIGYLSIVIYDHHQHIDTKFAQTDGFFVAPRRRSIKTFRKICDMFKQAESILKSEFGVQYFYLGVSAENDLKLLADCLKFRQSAIMYLKRL